MTPLPETIEANLLLETLSKQNNPDLGMLTAVKKSEIKLNTGSGMVPISPIHDRDSKEIPYSGILSLPMSTYDKDFLSIRFFDLAPATRAAVELFGGDKRVKDIYGVNMVFSGTHLSMSIGEASDEIKIATPNSGDLGVFERYIASTLLLVPKQLWSTVRKSGVIVLQDPVGYTGLPLVDLVAMPDDSGDTLGQMEKSQYLKSKQWELIGKPFVIHVTT